MATTAKPLDLKRLLMAFFSARSVTVDADGLRMWIDAFSDLTPEAVELALRRYNRECSDHPTPASVRRYAGAAGLTDEQRAMAAWRVVRSTILRYGAYYAINFDDPIIHAAIRAIGGWSQLCATPTEEFQWKAKEFVAAYVNVARSGIGEFKPLLGIAMTKNESISITTGLAKHPTVAAIAMNEQPPRRVALPDLSAKRIDR